MRMNGIVKIKCRHCKRLFVPDPRNRSRQKYCDKEECRKASKSASQKKWLNKPENQAYFRGPDHVKRVQEWRKKNPGYWKSKNKKASDALQDSLTTQPSENKEDKDHFADTPLQDFLNTQSAVIIGLISNFIGSALQDDIAETLLRMQQSGQDILYPKPQHKGGTHDCKIPGFTPTGAQSTQKLQLDRHRLVRERYLDRISHPAAALYLFLVCVGDDKGLSYYGDPSIMKTLSMDRQVLKNARSGLVRASLIAWQKPIYQVLCLEPEDKNRRQQGPAIQLGDIFKQAMGGAK